MNTELFRSDPGAMRSGFMLMALTAGLMLASIVFGAAPEQPAAAKPPAAATGDAQRTLLQSWSAHYTQAQLESGVYVGSQSCNSCHTDDLRRHRHRGLGQAHGMKADCHFCQPAEVLFENDLAYVIRDRFPTSPGHLHILTRRHVADWFETTAQERLALFDLADAAKSWLDGEFHPDGFNLGVNVGEVAVQTVFHVHLI